MGIRTVMITGDNPMTAAAIAAEAGVDDFLAEATPEAKLQLIRDEQAKGKLVAMCGDGTNDAPALAQADVGVAMNTGTVAAREAGNMVDLDSDPTKLIEVVEIGKQLLMTRGSLTTFSIANDVAKYFAIIPAMFAVIYPQLGALNVMGLATPESAILSAIIFNALIIIALIPLALRGVTYQRDRRRRAPAPQPRDLRPRRADRPVHRHQAHRPRHHRHRPRLKDKAMLKQLRPALVMILALTAITGLLYPLVITGLGQAIFPAQANGSLISRDGQVVGSALIGQILHLSRLLPRPPLGDCPGALQRGCLLRLEPGPDQRRPDRRVRTEAEALKAENPGAPVPIDLVTTSGSGLDPDITPAAADFQVPRVAAARGIDESELRALVEAHVAAGRLASSASPVSTCSP